MIEWALVQNDRLIPGTIDYTHVKFVGQDLLTYHVISIDKNLTL